LTEVDASQLESCEYATELSQLSRVCKQALQSLSIAGFTFIHANSSVWKNRLIKLFVGQKISAETYT